MESAKWNVKCTSDYQLWAFLAEFKSELKINLSKQVLNVKNQQLFGQFGFIAKPGKVWVRCACVYHASNFRVGNISNISANISLARLTVPHLHRNLCHLPEVIFCQHHHHRRQHQEWQAVDNYTNGLVLADIIIKSIFVLLQHKWLNKKRYVCCERNVQICKKGSI